MEKSTRIIVLSIVATGAAAAVILNNVRSDAIETPPQASSDFDNTAATEERIRALELAVSEERRARQLLEDELLAVYAEIDSVRAGLLPSAGIEPGFTEITAEDTIVNARAGRASSEGPPTDRRGAMIEAGLAPGRADHILRREEELRYESMQAVFEARNSGESIDRFSTNFNPDAMLREEIGDAEYELYLKGNGRPTSVGISNVMASSPGERAGLQSGDEIVGYDGERVFSSFELMQLTMAGGEGNVVIDVVREGSPMQIVLPRGPIGVEIGRIRGR